MEYAAEGRLPCCTKFSAQQLDAAMEEGRILQSTALVYDTDQSLRFSLGGIPAIMPHEETADGICTGAVREIAVLTRVGRATCFVILRREGSAHPRYLLSRARAQRRCREEYLDRLISLKIVDTLDEAIAHINRYNTGHSEAIVTQNYENAMRFLNEIDAAAVYVNASTRFTDGGEFGFGAEIGISTQKLHARGPMGLLALTTTKYIILGNGQIR